MRLVPSSDATADVIRAKGGHPFVEVVLRDSKLIWDITSHLFAKWGLPVIVQVHGQPTCIRARIAAFLPEPTPDKPVDAMPVLDATYCVLSPTVPAVVFKAARGALLLPDAPPSPPPLPPLPPVVSGPPRTQNPHTKRTYATAPLLSDVESKVSAPHETRPFQSDSREPSVSIPTSSHSLSSRSVKDGVSSPTQSMSKSFGPPPIPPLPESRGGHSLGPSSKFGSKKPQHNLLNDTSDACAPTSEITSASEACDDGNTDQLDNVSASGESIKEAKGVCNLSEKIEPWKRTTTSSFSLGRAAKRRRVFVSDGIEWLERTEPSAFSPGTIDVGPSEPILPANSISQLAKPVGIQGVESCPDIDFQDSGFEIPESFLEKESFAMPSLHEVPTEIAESLFALDGRDGDVSFDSGKKINHEIEAPQNESSTPVQLEAGGANDLSEAVDIEHMMTGMVHHAQTFENAGESFDSDKGNVDQLFSDENIGFVVDETVGKTGTHPGLSNGQADAESEFDPAELNALLDL